MRARLIPLAAALLLLPLSGASAQESVQEGVQEEKKPLDHDAYDVWNRIGARSLSPNGSWLAYTLVPGEGDATLVVRDLDSGAELRIARGDDAVFTDDSRFLVAVISPAEEEDSEEEEEEGATGEEEASEETSEEDGEPTDTLAVLDLGRVFGGDAPDPALVDRTPRLRSFRVPEEGASMLAYLLEPEEEEEDAPEPAEGEAGETEPEPPAEPAEPTPQEERRKTKEDGAPLVLVELASGEERTFEHVTDYHFTEEGDVLYFTTSSKDGTADGLFRVASEGGDATPLLTGEGRYVQLAVSTGSGAAAVLSDRDDQESEEPALALFIAGLDDDEARLLVTPDAPGIPEGWWISGDGALRFSESGARVFFGTAERSDAEAEEDADDDEEEVRVDVWNWKDDYLQPMQLVQARRDRDRTFDAMVPASGGAVLQLETALLPSVTVADDGDGSVAMGQTDLPYRQLLSWDGRYNDVWLVDLESGERERVAERIRGFRGASLSPDGRYVYWWGGADRHWWILDTERRMSWTATAAVPTPLWDELDDHPQDPPPYGTAGWTDDGKLLVYDRHDIWAVDPDPEGDEPRNVTEGVGRREGLRFRHLRTDFDEDVVPTGEDVHLSAFDYATKEEGIYRDRIGSEREPERLVMGAFDLGLPREAEDGETFVLTRETFRDFPDLHVTGPDFGTLERVSEANPQQDEYRWGSAELYEWTSTDGIPLQGILYKPDGFDPSEEYPMLVYFYERLSSGLHNHYVPSAGGSSINRSFYVSRGYLVFVPDIPYEIGFPGESALDAVVPGVLALVDEGFVDPERIGVQGHSWGGYQIAHMITRTNLFAAAEAGAPVSNMTSAYGGIRWGSGMSRMFQYERTQSRIGGTLWNAQHRYIENSPVFFADKIETPLLMMHNDEDGAVPWYQGIELFVAMRRLGKPVWMLNYNGEAHGLRQEHNREDWAVRMQQFFDHFLKDAPPPVWLAEGVPAEEKGETLGLDLLTEEGAMEKPVSLEGSGGS